MWPVAGEAYAYLAGHPFLTDTVLHNGKTDNDRQIINKQHTAAEVNQHINPHKKAQIMVVCVPIYIQLIDRGCSDRVNNITVVRAGINLYAVSMQEMLAINVAVICHYFTPGLLSDFPSQPQST